MNHVLRQRVYAEHPALIVLAGGLIAVAFVIAHQEYPRLANAGLGAVLCAAAAYWFLQSPMRCLYAVVVSAPLEATAVLEVGFTLKLAYIFTMLAFASTYLVSRRRTLPVSGALIPLALFAMISALSLVQVIFYPPPKMLNMAESVALRSSGIRPFVQLFMLALNVALFVNVLMLLRDKARIRSVLRVYVVVSVFVALYGLYQPIAVAYDLPLKDITNALNTSAEGYGGVAYSGYAAVLIRPRSTFQEAANLGQYLLSSLVLLLVYNPFGGRRREMLRYAAIGILTWGIIATMSRGTFVATAVLLPMLLLAVRQTSRKAVAALAVAAVLFSVAITPVIGLLRTDSSLLSAALGRFGSDTLSEGPRATYFRVMLSTWSKHPLLGVGLGSYGAYGSAVLGIPVVFSAHGVWWAVLVEHGILGFAAFNWFIWSILAGAVRAMRQKHDPELSAMTGGLIAAVVGCLVQYLFFGDRMTIFVWLLMGMLVAASGMAARGSSADEFQGS